MFRWLKRTESRGVAPEEDLRCSFCGKHQEDVRKLIAGPAVRICDECVDICADIIAGDETLQAPPASRQAIRQSEHGCVRAVRNAGILQRPAGGRESRRALRRLC